MNILQQEDLIKGLPDQALMQQAQMPTGELPQFLVVSEIQRREKMRKSFAEAVPEESIKDQVISSGIAAMNPTPDPLMANAMGVQGGQDPMMGQMQDPMQQQMMQDPMQQQMPMQDPMMQQQVMASGGGMMPYRMDQGMQVPNLIGSSYGLPANRRTQDITAIMAELGVPLEEAIQIFNKRNSQNIDLEMDKFRRETASQPPYEGGGMPASISGNNIPGREEESIVVPEDVTIGKIKESLVSARNDGTIAGVQDVYPETQKRLGPELGYAVGKTTEDLVDTGLGPFGLTSSDAMDVLKDIKEAGRAAGEVIGRDLEYISDRGPEFSELASNVSGGISDLASKTGSNIYSFLEDQGLVNNQAIKNAILGVPDAVKNAYMSSPFSNYGGAVPSQNEDPITQGEPTPSLLAGIEDSGINAIDRFRNMLDGKPSWFGNAVEEDANRTKTAEIVDPEVVKLAAAPNTGENKVGPADTDRELTAVDRPETEDVLKRIGTDSARGDDPEGILKGLFGRSYKPMDDGALALINLGAGIAKGDIAGGMLGAVKSIGESRDRDRKDMLAKAQVEYYTGGGRGSRDDALDVEIRANQMFNDLGVVGQTQMYEQLTGNKPTAEIRRSPQYKETIMNGLRANIVKMKRTPLSSMAGAGIDKVQQVNRLEYMGNRLFQ